MSKTKNSIEELEKEITKVVLKVHEGGQYLDIGVSIHPAIDELLALFKKYADARFQASLPEKRIEFVETFDNSGHRYQIPWNKRDEWYKWCEIPEDDERSWEVPAYAERIDGMPITDNRGFNNCILEITANWKAWEEER